MSDRQTPWAYRPAEDRLSSTIRHKLERLSPAMRAGIAAYRAALNERQDWLASVVAAMEAYEAARENTDGRAGPG